MLEIDFKELFSGLEVKGGDGNLFTAQEISEACGKSVGWVRKMIHKAKAAGVCEVGKKMVTRCDNCVTPVSAYRFIDQEKGQ